MSHVPFYVEMQVMWLSPPLSGYRYAIFINAKSILQGDRATRGGALRAARAQLKQLKKDIERKLQSP